MNTKKLLTILAASALLLNLTSCAKYPSEKDIQKRAIEFMAGEDCDQVDYDKDSGIITLTYESNERDLEFHVYGYKTKSLWELHTDDGFDDMTEPKYSSDYVHNIHELYLDDIKATLKKIGGKQDMDKNWNYDTFRFTASFDDPADVDEIVAVLIKANEIYSEELNYHDEEWLLAHKFCVVAINYRNPNSSETNHYAIVNIDGVSDADYFYDKINSVIERVDNG